MRYSGATLCVLFRQDAGRHLFVNNHTDELSQFLALMESSDSETVYSSLECLSELSKEIQVQEGILDSVEGCISLKILLAPTRDPPYFHRPAFKVIGNLCQPTNLDFKLERTIQRFPDILSLCFGGLSYGKWPSSRSNEGKTNKQINSLFFFLFFIFFRL